MTFKPQDIVETGYDRIAARYLAWTGEIRGDPRLQFLNQLIARLPAHPVMLDLGCGAGVPCTALLAGRGTVAGVDLSASQLKLARQNVPLAQFIKADMTSLDLRPASLDAVTAFYSIARGAGRAAAGGEPGAGAAGRRRPGGAADPAGGPPGDQGGRQCAGRQAACPAAGRGRRRPPGRPQVPEQDGPRGAGRPGPAYWCQPRASRPAGRDHPPGARYGPGPAQLKDNDAQLLAIVQDIAPGLTSRFGVGPVSAAQAIVSFSHPGRCRNEAAFAALGGTSPIPASSGRTIRHRLNRGGDRALNRAIHAIAVSRMRSCPHTRAYVARRTAEGKTTREIRRCLNRYIARELYRQLTRTMNPSASP